MDWLVDDVSKLEYDVTNPASIEAYAQKMIGKTFKEVTGVDKVSSGGNRGGLGQLIETNYFHYGLNGESRADFEEAGVEVKTTVYKQNKNGTFSAKERLSLTLINYMKVIYEKDFYTSSLWKKSKCMLIVYYLFNKDIHNTMDYKIKYATLFTPPEQDVLIIKKDYDIILDKINQGLAHTLSESQTLYLGAAPKGKNKNDVRQQPFNEKPAMRRGFALKMSYMTYVLNNYIIPGRKTYTSDKQIIKGKAVESFEDYVTGKVGEYHGWSIEELCQKFGIKLKYNKDGKIIIPKNLCSMIICRILDIKGKNAKKADEFEKAGIEIKTVRIEKTGNIVQSMSFPAFKFKELIKEDTWEDSKFGNYLRDHRLLLIVFKFDENDVLRLQGCQFWSIPYEDLEVEVRSVWEKTKKVLIDGLQFEKVKGKYTNNLPGMADNKVSHVRPHGRDSKDVDELPDGRMYPKQCFWLNSKYVKSQLRDDLK